MADESGACLMRPWHDVMGMYNLLPETRFDSPRKPNQRSIPQECHEREGLDV